MPYSESDYLTQPSAGALAEALLYKAVNWYRLNDTDQIKAALVNRKPVVCGIVVYESFYYLSGNNSVYNTNQGQLLGYHAVTIVGYDDNKFGGAFKVINSWGTAWGDNGYFWMPYSFAQVVTTEAYVLEDGENGSVSENEDTTEPEHDNSTLPNLTIASWNASYDPRPRGTGTLTYEVINNGQALAVSGANINLMLSRNTQITSSDDYVVYEEVPYDLQPGASVYRDSTNALSFNFPDPLEEGIYYIAVWVDDMGEIAESNENDNISRGNNTITIENFLSDLSINSWYATWDGYGNGTLTYEVENSGASITPSDSWYINLILDPDTTLENGNEIFLFYEQAGYYLRPGEMIYRNSSNPANFDLYVDYEGQTVPTGDYYMALWIDDLNSIDESNELNNSSYSWGVTTIAGSGDAKSASADNLLTTSSNEALNKAYNGKKLPPADLPMRKVLITKNSSGGVTLQLLNTKPVKGIRKPQKGFLTKHIFSGTNLIFPSSEKIPMPPSIASIMIC